MGDRVSATNWFEGALADDDVWCGVDLYEMTDSPVRLSGHALLAEACFLLDAFQTMLHKRGLDVSRYIPYLRFCLPETHDASYWSPKYWEDIRGDHTSIELNKEGSAFYWGTWESHHATVEFPTEAYPGYMAIFRSYKGFYIEPWDAYKNEIYVFARESISVISDSELDAAGS